MTNLMGFGPIFLLHSLETACGGNGDEPGTPTQEFSDGEERDEDPMAPLASSGDDLGSDEDNTSTGKPPPWHWHNQSQLYGQGESDCYQHTCNPMQNPPLIPMAIKIHVFL